MRLHGNELSSRAKHRLSAMFEYYNGRDFLATSAVTAALLGRGADTCPHSDLLAGVTRAITSRSRCFCCSQSRVRSPPSVAVHAFPSAPDRASVGLRSAFG